MIETHLKDFQLFKILALLPEESTTSCSTTSKAVFKALESRAYLQTNASLTFTRKYTKSKSLYDWEIMYFSTKKRLSAHYKTYGNGFEICINNLLGIKTDGRTNRFYLLIDDFFRNELKNNDTITLREPNYGTSED